MIITIFGATGQVGIRVVRMALAKGFHVRAFGRNIEGMIDEDLRNENFEAVKGYVFDEKEVRNAVKGADAVISALGGSFDGTDKTRSLGIKNIVKQMEAAGTKRIIAIGGMGVLKDDEYEYMLKNPDYPEQFIAVGNEHLQAYQFLNNSNLSWTFLCPPNIIDADATGEFITAADYPPQPNQYKINAGDLALFMLNEITDNNYVCQRVGISSK